MSDIAALVTAISGLLTAGGGALVVFLVVIPGFRQTKDVHKIVNQQRTDMIAYQKVLEAVLTDHGIMLPTEESK